MSISVKICLVLALFVAEGLAIKCYICNSINETGCALPESKYLKDCNDSPDGHRYTVCRKTNQAVPPNSLGNTTPRVIRSCGYEPSKTECVVRAGLGAEQRVCTCDTDGCNGATNYHITMASLVSMAFLGFFIPKILS